MNKTQRFIVAMGTLGFASAVLVAAPAAAESAPSLVVAVASDTLLPEFEEAALAKMDELGVESSKRAALLAKMATRAVLDSDPASGIAPVSVSEYRVGITDYTRSVWPDGSVTLDNLERPMTPSYTGGLPGGSISPTYISECSYALSAGVASYSNCKIGHNTLWYFFWFKASYWQSASGSAISSVSSWDWQLDSLVDSCPLDFVGKVDNNNARLRSFCTFAEGGGGYKWVHLTVTKTSATQSSNY